ncbi:myb-binding protein 1A [Contarinia nasturtii]|uniref:myb-binding protein 1A n=1 Tax=Contarinia nasturtii TaxID=265458 RepID=UPI0012D42924|nr:myb-binding protein 1A [Contarinia nasturtii]
MKAKEQHVDALKQSKNNKNSNIGNKISESFKKLTNSEKLNRINGAVNLLQHLKEIKIDENQVEKVRNVRRFVRGLGASTSDSRSGFYAALVAFLATNPDDYPTITNLFELMDVTLSVGAGSNIEKEDSDALIGRVLVCASILHANKLNSASDSEIKKCIETLINASHYKSYHSSLAYTFLLELLEKISEKQFNKIMWPLMQKELKRPWEKQNINTVQFLIKCQSKYPAAIDEDFLSSSLQTSDILTPLAYKHLGRLFWSPATTMIAVTHPSYEVFGQFLSQCVPEKKLLDFWYKEINEILLAPTKFKEIVTLRLLTILFNGCQIKSKTAIALLSNAFIALLTKSLRSSKQQKNNDNSSPTLYTQFFNAIEKYTKQESISETDKVAIILKFIDFPGTLVIEKYTPIRVIHKFIVQLKSDGVKELVEFYKNILLDRKTKNPKSNEGWLHMEREHCVQMLQTLIVQKSVQNDRDWRAEQLQFLLKYGLFYVNKQTDAIVKERDSDVLPNDLAHKLKQAFFSSLQAKSQNIEAEKITLLTIIEYCNKQLSSKSINKTLRHPLSDDALQAWRKMYANVTTKKKTKKILYNVFDILLMHMGLQLFVDAQMAIFSIDDLEKCLERSQNKLKAKTKSNETNEAEWIEVVVDLFLQLLSQSKSFMRTVVDNVFPELCPALTPAAVDQILMMLDMSEKNPLTPHNATAESDDEEMESDDETESDEENGIESDDEDADESSDDEDFTDADEEGTVTDHLRSAVSQALGGAIPETDTESVDLNDMDDEEAQRLDAALSDAFRAIRKKTGESKKKTKLERTTNTTVMHFRIRVLDLIEIYLKTSPSLAITLNILTDLIPMYEQCVGNKDHQPLVNRLQRVLRMLLNLREFSNIDDVNEIKLYELFQSIINVKANPVAINEQNKLRSNLCAFLIAVSQLLNSPDPILLEAVAGCLENFLRVRNPKVQYTVFSDIFKTRWVGVWRLGQIIARTSLLRADKCRPFRRSQAIDLLSMMYKNHGFIANDTNEFNEHNIKIEAAIHVYVEWAKTSDQVSSKEFSSLLVLFQEMHKCTQTIGNYKCTVKWPKICDSVQLIRQKIELDSYQVYFAFCKRLEIKDIKNSEVDTSKTKNGFNTENGHQNSDGEDEEADEENGGEEESEEEIVIESKPTVTNGVTNGKKRKADTDNGGLSKKRKAKLEKKLRKQNRLKMSSAGMEDVAFSFTPQTNNDKEDMDSD